MVNITASIDLGLLCSLALTASARMRALLFNPYTDTEYARGR